MSGLDTATVKKLYESLAERRRQARERLGKKALTYAEKVLFSHLTPGSEPWTMGPSSGVERGVSFLSLQPDRVAMQDATAQMAILQFMQANRDAVAVPSTVHCDHLIRAHSGAEADVKRAIEEN